MSKFLKELQKFDPKESYPGYPGMTPISHTNHRKQIGTIAYLMAIIAASGSEEELARAIKHSMVLIDAEKHRLNWKQSEKDNGIKDLINKYMKKKEGE